ncbi:MAG: copper chaperone PCu(A)C [Actinomycetota bacterium]|nr:copper chaperone PCu(A)C [Actinomycetota bacterium]
MPVHQAATAELLLVTRRRTAVLVATLLAVIALLPGCGRARGNEVTFQPSGTSEGRVGDIVLSDALFEFRGPIEASAVYRPGESVSVQATIVNDGTAPDRLVSVSSPIAGGGVIDGDGAIPGRHVLTAGYPKPVAAVTLPDTTSVDLRLTDLKTAIRAGLTYPVVFTFARAGQLGLQLRVENPDKPREDCPLPANGRPPQVFTAPVGQAPVPPIPPPPGCSSIDEQLPRLLALSAQVDDKDDKFDKVVLRFRPGSEVPLTSIEQSDDGKIRFPDSNDMVQLAGTQALRVTVSPALLGDAALLGDVTPVPADLPSVAEIRVLGSSQGETVLGIGVKGQGDLNPQVDNTDARTVIRIKHPPHPPADKRKCGSVVLVRPESGPDSEASGIEAMGTSCDIARDVAALAKDHLDAPYGTPTGYSCQMQKQDQDPTVIVDYLCRRAQEQITFTVS